MTQSVFLGEKPVLINTSDTVSTNDKEHNRKQIDLIVTIVHGQ